MHPMSVVSRLISSSSRFATWSGTRAARCDSTIVITSLSWPGVMCVEATRPGTEPCGSTQTPTKRVSIIGTASPARQLFPSRMNSQSMWRPICCACGARSSTLPVETIHTWRKIYASGSNLVPDRRETYSEGSGTGLTLRCLPLRMFLQLLCLLLLSYTGSMLLLSMRSRPARLVAFVPWGAPWLHFALATFCLCRLDGC